MQCGSPRLVAHAFEYIKRILSGLRQVDSPKPRYESLTSMPLHRNKGTCLPLMSISTYFYRCAMRVWKVIEAGAKWQAASVRSQVMGLVSGPRSRWLLRWDVYRCLFSVTRPIGVERRNAVQTV